MKMRHFERGQALIVVALALVGLFGMAGLVIDGGNAFQDRQQAQNAADAAAPAVMRVPKTVFAPGSCSRGLK